MASGGTSTAGTSAYSSVGIGLDMFPLLIVEFGFGEAEGEVPLKKRLPNLPELGDGWITD